MTKTTAKPKPSDSTPGSRYLIPHQYTHPDTHSHREDARYEFLEAITDVTSNVLRTLAKEPFQCFGAIAESETLAMAEEAYERWRLSTCPEHAFDDFITPWDVVTWHLDADPAPVKEFSEALRGWAVPFNLNTPWVLRYASYTLQEWYEAGSPDRRWRGIPRGTIAVQPGVAAFQFQFIPFLPLHIILGAFEAELRNRFELELADWKQRAQARVEELGLQSPRMVSAHHFRWAATAVILGSTYQAIAEQHSAVNTKVSAQAVGKAVNGVLDLIELPVSPRTKHRRRSSTNIAHR